MRIFHHGFEQLDGDRHLRRAGDVVEVDRDRHRFEQLGVVVNQPLGGRLVEVERRDHQQAIGAHALGVLGQIDGLHDVGRTGAHHDVHVALVLHGSFGDELAFRDREAGEFTRGAEHDDAIGAAFLVPFHHRLHGAGIKHALGVARRDGRHPIGDLFLRSQPARAHLRGGGRGGQRECGGCCTGQRIPAIQLHDHSFPKLAAVFTVLPIDCHHRARRAMRQDACAPACQNVRFLRNSPAPRCDIAGPARHR